MSEPSRTLEGGAVVEYVAQENGGWLVLVNGVDVGWTEELRDGTPIRLDRSGIVRVDITLLASKVIVR